MNNQSALPDVFAYKPRQVLRPSMLSGIPEHTAHRMMMTRGSELLLSAIRPSAEPEPVLQQRKAGRPKRDPLPPDSLAGDLIEAAAFAFKVSLEELKGPARWTELVLARSVAIRLLRDKKFRNGEPRYSFARIGRLLSRDHTTILYAFKTYEERAAKFPEMDEIYQDLRERSK